MILVNFSTAHLFPICTANPLPKLPKFKSNIIKMRWLKRYSIQTSKMKATIPNPSLLAQFYHKILSGDSKTWKYINKLFFFFILLWRLTAPFLNCVITHFFTYFTSFMLTESVLCLIPLSTFKNQYLILFTKIKIKNLKTKKKN